MHLLQKLQQHQMLLQVTPGVAEVPPKVRVLVHEERQATK